MCRLRDLRCRRHVPTESLQLAALAHAGGRWSGFQPGAAGNASG